MESLKRLHTEKKDAWGRFALGGQLLDLASSGPLQALGVELNVVYLRLLRELVDRAKWGTAAHAADLAARLLRSPSHGLFAFSKVPGYYQDVLAWGARHPALFTALGSLLDSVDRQASRGSAPQTHRQSAGTVGAGHALAPGDRRADARPGDSSTTGQH
ncbi:hypothetical protein [Burkholderia cenocepacia]|uniref:hypothetical protein n=1 Tax=Burkholderia cenocepacia TaxID=95486 RepID=UPI001177A81F|nr:hypothetical protein [Burkholderia cenocepacia]